MITREVAIVLSFPAEVLTARRLGPDAEALKPVTHRPRWAPGVPADVSAALGLSQTVPVTEDALPRIGDFEGDCSGGDVDDEDALAVEADGGPAGERVFGHRGIGRQRVRVRVLVRSGRDANAEERARKRVARAAHIVACATRAHVPLDWSWSATAPTQPPQAFPAPPRRADGRLADSVPTITFGEIAVYPVTSVLGEDDRPIFMFTAEIVRWQSSIC